MRITVKSIFKDLNLIIRKFFWIEFKHLKYYIVKTRQESLSFGLKNYFQQNKRTSIKLEYFKVSFTHKFSSSFECNYCCNCRSTFKLPFCCMIGNERQQMHSRNIFLVNSLPLFYKLLTKYVFFLKLYNIS